MNEIPNVTGKPFDDAKKEIEDAGYICVERGIDPQFAHEKDGGVRFNDPAHRKPCAKTVVAGTVIEQDPPGGISRLGDERGAPRVFLVVAGEHPETPKPEVVPIVPEVPVA